MRKLKKPLSILLALMIIFSVFTVIPFSAADSVSYLGVDFYDSGRSRTTDEICTDYIVLTEDITSLADGWYIADDDLDYPDRLEVSGDVRLIICDGVRVNAGQGIHVPDGASFTVYSQSLGDEMGQLYATTSHYSYEYAAALGGDNGEKSGVITINGGHIDVRSLSNDSNSNNRAAAIGGGYNAGSGAISINNGYVYARSCGYGCALGTGLAASYVCADPITISGGTVIAYSPRTSSESPAIGSVFEGGTDCASITITGGYTDASGFPAFNGCDVTVGEDIRVKYYDDFHRHAVIDYAPYHITVENAEHGTVSVPDTVGREGENIPLTITPDSGYTTESIKVNGVEVIPNDYFTMPAQDVTVTASFVPFVPWEGEGTDDVPYIIRSTEDWNTLAKAYEQYDKSFMLGDDITVSTMIGSSNHPFKGNFDGDGHKLTFNLDTNEDYAAPFRCATGDSSFRNLIVDGTINSGAKFAAGVVAYYHRKSEETTMLFENIRCDITINSSVDGNGTHGGLLACADDSIRCNVNMNGCAFTGKMLGHKTTHCGGLIGYANSMTRIRDCVFAPEEFTFNLTDFNSIGRLAEGHSQNYLQADNSYYTVNAGHGLGRLLCRLSYDDGLDLGFVRSEAEYSVSHIAAYNKGIELDGKLYTGLNEEIAVTPRLEDGYTIVGIWLNDTEIAASADGTYSFAMPAEDVHVSFETEQFNAWDGDGTENSPYIIHNTVEWNRLRQRPDYNDRCFRLAADITVNTMIGIEAQPFTGSFDGGGYSITFNYQADHEYAAPFRYVSGGSFKDLSLSGRINTSMKYTAGLIACQTGETTIENCFSDVEICSSSTNTELGYSGFIGYSKNKDGQAANVIMTGCGYDGKMIPESEDAVPFDLLQPTGAFIGFSEGSAAFTDCLCLSDAGSFRSRVPAAFAYGITPTVTNSYYMSDCFSSKGQGIRGYYTHVGDGLTVDFGEAEKIYDVSGIERHESGLVYKGEMIAPSGTSVSFTAEADDGYRLTKIMVGSTVLISDADDVYSFNMPSGDVTINGEFELLNMWGGGGTELSPYIINSTDDWNKLRLCPQYFDCHFKLNADITVDEMIGSSEHPFTGYFDGNGHTMTLNITNDSDGSAPFRWVGGNHATIENLKIDGSITTNKRYAAGIIARLSGGSANIRRCRVSADFNVSYSNEGTHGGFVGAASDNSSLTIEGCVFDGKITDNGSTVNINSSGGFVGWMDGTAKLTNCLFMPLQLRLKTTDNSESGRNYTFVRSSSGASITLDNCYYTEALEVAQGTKGYTVTPGDHFTLNFGKFTKRYPVVKLFTFEKGMAIDCEYDSSKYTYGGTRIVERNTDVQFTVTPEDGYVINRLYANGDLLREPVNNKYTLTVPDENVSVTADWGLNNVKVDFGESHTALAAMYEGKSGYSVSGSVVTMPYEFCDLMTAGWSVLSDLETNVFDPDELFFEHNGERLYRNLGLKPMSEYDSEDAYLSDIESFSMDLIDENTVLYLMWERPVTEPAAITIGQLDCGTEISTVYNGNFSHSEPQPEIGVTGSIASTNTMGYLWYSDYTVGERYPDNIFSGTATGGDCYYTSANLDAPFGYFIDDTDLITVTGADSYWYSFTDPNNGALTFVAKVRAVHDLDDNDVCKFCGAEVKTITLDFGADHSDFVTRRFTTGIGKYVDGSDGKVLINSVADDGRIFLLTESNDKGETYYDLHRVLVKYVSGDECIDNGYRLMDIPGIHPLDYYDHDVDAYERDRSSLDGQPVVSGDTFYGLWQEPIRTAEFTVVRPVCGTEVSSVNVDQYSSLKRSEPPVEIIAPREIVLDTISAPSWLDGENSDQLFEGTIRGTEEYYFTTDINPIFGYYIPDDIEITINGGMLTDHGATWLNGSVIAVHDYNEDGVCRVCGSERAYFTKHSLTLNGDIGVNFYVNLTEDEAANATVDFSYTVNGRTKKSSVDLKNAEKTENGYRVTCYVSAPEMTNIITAALSIGGEEVEADRYSVKTYADKILSDTYRTEYLEKHTEDEYNYLAALIKTMLNYGAATQYQFADEHSNTAFANDGINYDLAPLTAEELSAINMPAPDKSAINAQLTGTGLKYYGYTMLLYSKTTLRFYFLKNSPDTDITGIHLNIGTGENTVTYNAKTYDEHFAYVEVEGIPAYELDNAYTLSVNGIELGSYSVLTYVKDVLTDSAADQTLKDTVTAMYRYHKAAVDWFDNANS